MEKHSQILTALQMNSEKQNESIQRLHEKNLENLNENLTDLYEKKLNLIEKTILSENIKTISNLNENLEQLKKNKIYLLAGTIIAGLITGILLTMTIAPSETVTSDWEVPPTQRHEENGKKYIVAPSDKTLSNENKTSTFILLEE